MPCPMSPCVLAIRVVGFETVRDVSLSNFRGKRRAIRKRLKRPKKKGGQLPVDLVKFAKTANGERPSGV
jgi:hypothetical protein